MHITDLLQQSNSEELAQKIPALHDKSPYYSRNMAVYWIF